MKSHPINTKEDIELADEIGTVVTIKGLFDGFYAEFIHVFNELTLLAMEGNPVTTYLSIFGAKNSIEEKLRSTQAQLLEILGEVDKVGAHDLASSPFNLVAEEPVELVDDKTSDEAAEVLLEEGEDKDVTPAIVRQPTPSSNTDEFLVMDDPKEIK